MPYTFSEPRGLRKGQSHTRARNPILWMTPRKATPMLWVLNMTKKYKDFSSHWKFSLSDTEARISFSQVPVGLSSLGVWKHDSKLGFPAGLVVKNPKNMLTNARDAGSITVSGSSPGGGNGNPLQYSCLGNPMDRRACWATIHVGTKASLNLSISLTPLNHKRGLETHTYTHIHTQTHTHTHTHRWHGCEENWKGKKFRGKKQNKSNFLGQEVQGPLEGNEHRLLRNSWLISLQYIYLLVWWEDGWLLIN